jgi:hypothetical protein
LILLVVCAFVLITACDTAPNTDDNNNGAEQVVEPEVEWHGNAKGCSPEANQYGACKAF